MRTSNETSELNHAAWRAMELGAQEGWDTAVANVVRLTNPEDTPERDAKIAFVSEFTGKVVNHVDELIVFHEDSGEYTRFGALIPDPKTPFDIAATSDPEKVPITHVKYRTKQFGFSAYNQMAAAREITFANDDETSRPVWMGAGIGSERTSPDLFFDNQTQGWHVAVGNTEIAELFGSLHREGDATYNARLFGALFHVAILADEFEVAVPQVDGLREEAEAARTTLEVETALTSTIITLARFNSEELKKMTDVYAAQTVIAESLGGQLDTVKNVTYLPALHRPYDSPTATLTGIYRNLSNAHHTAMQLTKEQLEHRKALNRMTRILGAITGQDKA